MKRLHRVLLIGFALVMVLTACGDTPINVPISDFSFSVDAVGYTANQVIYPGQPAQFDKTYINVKTITLSGKLTVTYTPVSSPIKMTFYARVDDPANDDNCTGSADTVYICDSSNEIAISDEYTFNTGETITVNLGTENPEILAEGINNGEIWIGAEVTSGLATDVTFDFTNMVAHVTLY